MKRAPQRTLPEPVIGENLCKEREVRFRPEPPGQAEKAVRHLSGYDGLKAEVSERPCTVVLRYNLAQHTLSRVIDALLENGFRLDESLYCRTVRALIVFAEETEIANLQQPPPP